jgi:hypothetical protein
MTDATVVDDGAIGGRGSVTDGDGEASMAGPPSYRGLLWLWRSAYATEDAAALLRRTSSWLGDEGRCQEMSRKHQETVTVSDG